VDVKCVRHSSADQPHKYDSGQPAVCDVSPLVDAKQEVHRHDDQRNNCEHRDVARKLSKYQRDRNASNESEQLKYRESQMSGILKRDNGYDHRAGT